MKARTAYFAWVLIPLFMLYTATATPQDTPTYTLDPNFNTGNLFRDGSGITSLVLYEDGRVLAGGGFSPFEFWSSFDALGMVWADGSEFTDWGEGGGTNGVTHLAKYQTGFLSATSGAVYRYDDLGTPMSFVNGVAWMEYFREGAFPNNPYNVESMWCVYVQEDDKVLIGGAVATDTTQPYLFRNLMRVLPDGSHDTTFPAIEIEPNIQFSAIYTIDKDNQGRWIVSGDFWAVNGHQTAHVARLNQDFSVDTTFVSPLEYHLLAPLTHAFLVDDLDRIWMAGRSMFVQGAPLDTINILRVLPTGEIDATFIPRRLDENYSFTTTNAPTVLGGLHLEGSDHYLLHGRFSHFNDTLQPCITVVDDAGYIQHNYFQNGGATAHNFFGNHFWNPIVGAVAELPDGSLIVGGAFSEFMGATHYNMVKLNLSTLGTRDREKAFPLSVHPNPAADHFLVSAPDANGAGVYVHDLSGRTLYQGVMTGETLRIPTTGFAPGLYVIHVQDGQGTAVKKIVVE